MGFQLAEHSEAYIKRAIVYAYDAKFLGIKDAIRHHTIIADLRNETRNFRALCSQGGVEFLHRKVMEKTVVVRIRYQNKIEVLEFDKRTVFEEAKVLCEKIEKQIK